MNDGANARLISAVAILLLLGVAAFIFNQRESKRTLPSPSALVTAKPVSKVKLHPATHESIDHAVLLNQALLEKDPQKRSIAFGILLSQWLEEDSESAVVYIKSLPQGAQFNEGLFMALQSIGTNDAARATILAGEMANTKEQKQIFNALFSQFAQRDLTNALSILGLTPPGESRENALRAIASVWSATNMNGSIEWAKAITDTDERNAALETVLMSLAKQDPKRAFMLGMENLSGEALESVAASGLRGMLQTDPTSVSQLIIQLPSGELQTGLTMDVARALAEQKPENAVAWLQTLPSGELRQLALNNVLDAWNAQSPAEVAQFILQMPAGADQDAAVSHMSHEFGSANPDQAMRWAQSLPNDSTRNAAVVNIISGWAENDPVAATVWAQNLPADSPVRTQALQGAFSYWELQDATAANAFSNSLSKAEQTQLFGAAK